MPTATATKSARFQTRRNFLLQYQTRRRLVMSSIPQLVLRAVDRRRGDELVREHVDRAAEDDDHGDRREQCPERRPLEETTKTAKTIGLVSSATAVAARPSFFHSRASASECSLTVRLRLAADTASDCRSGSAIRALDKCSRVARTRAEPLWLAGC